MISTQQIVSREVIRIRISGTESPSRLEATLAVSESTWVEIQGFLTNKGAAICALVEFDPSE